MIERFFLKDYLSFEEVELNLKMGLVVFTGPSGSGKSILLNSILSSLGNTSCEATLCESLVTWVINEDALGIKNDEVNVFKHIRKDKSRYFINNQSLSKKAISSITSKYLRYLNLKDFSDFENENLLNILDSKIETKVKSIKKLKTDYKTYFLEYQEIKKELHIIIEDEKKIIELKEFTTYEIKKIQDIDPKIGEDDKLLKIKKELSAKEKMLANIESASEIFNYEHLVFLALESLNEDSNLFTDTMNELRGVFESTQDRLLALDDINIEDILNRIEELSGLKRRYGGIQEALEYKRQKELELKKYKNIEITKNNLHIKYEKLFSIIKKLAHELTQLRVKELSNFENDLNKYLNNLHLKDAKININEIEYSALGQDKLDIKLNKTQLSKISTGEFNRLRLAILALKSEFIKSNGGILILDEIDANLSGEESMSVAKVLKQLSKYFQIFAISHQPQLTSMGDQHFLVYKDKDISKVKELNLNEKVEEIARIISGDTISSEAKKFAKELLGANNGSI